MGVKIPFIKMTGSGNDFILVDNRKGLIDAERAPDVARKACRHKLSVGSDGLILIEDDSEADFSWRFFNADGSEAEMCGNGARCAARFAVIQGIVNRPSMVFRTGAGLIRAELTGPSKVKVQIPGVRDLRLHLHVPISGLEDLTPASIPSLSKTGDSLDVHYINTGVPHVVVPCETRDKFDAVDVVRLGRFIRFHSLFSPRGTNVNFVWVSEEGEIFNRTYERGVEDETLACGTGSIASAIISAALGKVHSPVAVHTRGGEILRVFFDQRESDFSEVFLEGQALIVYEGLLWDETLEGSL
ncbi:MAG: diaminopimelate epimerase [Syntrophobacterales bacterium]|nr:diaminopimelate epimerase [Syntrophobacterales bacterium]